MPTKHFANRIFLTIAIIFSFFLATPTIARDPIPRDANGKELKGGYPTNVFEPAIQSQDVNLQSTVYEIYLSILSSMAKSPFSCGPDYKCELSQAPDGSTIAEKPTGLIPDLLGINSSMLSSRVITSQDYIADIGSRLNLINKPAYAQGIGYSGFTNILPVWTAFRNIAYLACTIGFVIMAFMIMLRMRAGQGLLTAQSAIFKFVFVVLAITFSYAISGFIMDLLYVFSYLAIWLFISTGLITGNVNDVANTIFSRGIISTAASILTGSGAAAGDQIGWLANQLFDTALSGYANAFAWVFGGMAGSIASIIISIAIVYSLFKLFIQFLFAYIQIILLTVLAPLFILPDVLPGGNSFQQWLRNILGHAMIWPATTFVLLLGLVILGTSGGANPLGLTINNTTTQPQIMNMPFLGNINTTNITAIIGIGFILVIPKVNDMTKEFFKASGFKYMSAIGQAVGVGVAGTRTLTRPITQPVSKFANEIKRQKTIDILEDQQLRNQAAGKLGRASFFQNWAEREKRK